MVDRLAGLAGRGGVTLMIATRYLLLPRLRGARVYAVPLGALVLSLLAAALLRWMQQADHGPLAFQPSRIAIEGALRWTWMAAALATFLSALFAWLMRRYTIFTSISIFCLFFGSAGMVIALSVMAGFEQDLKHKILGANAHVLVASPDQPFTDYERVAASVRSLPQVEAVMPYLANEVMVSSPANLAGVLLKGIDPAAAARVTDLARNMDRGSLDNLLHPEVVRDLPPPSFVDLDPPRRPRRGDVPAAADGGDGGATSGELDPGEPEPLALHDAVDGGARAAGAAVARVLGGGEEDDRLPPVFERGPRKLLPGVLIGRELARNLRVFLGDDVNVISPMGDIGPAGPIPRSRPFRIAGIFYSGMYEYDTKHVYTTIAAAQKFLGLEDEVTGVEIRVSNPDETRRIVDQIVRALGPAAARYEVRDWQELNSKLFSALKVERIAMFILLSFFALVTGFSMVANGIMLVREKERQVSILKAMGASDRAVLEIFSVLGVYMGALGIGAGVACGAVCCSLLARFGIKLDTDVYYITSLPIRVDVIELAAVFLTFLTIAVLATLYPALLAARLRPVDGLREDHG